MTNVLQFSGASLGLRGVALTLLILSTFSCERDASRGVMSIFQATRAAGRNAENGAQVRIRGVVTYAEVQAGDGVIEDQSGGIRVLLRKQQAPLEVGQDVEAWGILRSIRGAGLLVEPMITVLGRAALPEPQKVNLAHGGLENLVNRRITLPGTVESRIQERPYIDLLTVRSQGARAIVRVRRMPGTDFEKFTDTEFQITGTLVRAGELHQEFRVWSPDVRSMKVIRSAPDPEKLRARTAREASRLVDNGASDHRIRLRGVLKLKSGTPRLEDATGAIVVHIRPDSTQQPEDAEADLCGFLKIENGEAILDQAVPVVPAKVQMKEVNTALALHRLPANIAALHLPVHFQPVVTYSDPANAILFVQDATDGIFVQLKSPFAVSLRTGDRVDLSGETTVGEFAPNVGNATVRIIGQSEVPDPEKNLESLFAGQMDCRWAELSGIVQDATGDKSLTIARVQWGNLSFNAVIAGPLDDVRRLIDHRVVIRGAIGSLFNSRRQFLGVKIFVPGLQFMHALDDSSDFSSLAPEPVSRLLQFSPTAKLGHRVRVQGVVTASNPSGPTWISDSTGGMKISTHEPAELKRGDLVDVFGFPEAGGYGVAMKGASIKKLRSGVPFTPIQITPEDAEGGSVESQLVRIDGTIVNTLVERADRVVALRSGPYLFDVRLPFDSSGESATFSRLRSGAEVRVIGICSLILDRSSDLVVPRGFEVLLATPADIAVLHDSPWLTMNHLAKILLAMLIVVVSAFGWIAMLRRNVRLQTRQLEQANALANQALGRARQAESLEQDRKLVLEMVAKDEPLETIMEAMARLVVKHVPRALCSIQLDAADNCRISIPGDLPEPVAQGLAQTPVSEIPGSALLKPISKLAADLEWPVASRQAHDLAGNYLAVPIRRNLQRVGVILTLWPEACAPTPEEAGILESWGRFAGLSVERRGHYQQLDYRAHYDDLTGLFNRTSLHEQLASELAQSAKPGRTTGLLYLDLDRFKPVNDQFGHDAGDAVLREVSRRISRTIRHTDIAARVGGDEFVVVLPALRDRLEAQRVGELLVNAIRQPILVHGRTMHVGASLGIGIYPDDGADANTLLKFADQAMYCVKSKAKSLTSARNCEAEESLLAC